VPTKCLTVCKRRQLFPHELQGIPAKDRAHPRLIGSHAFLRREWNQWNCASYFARPQLVRRGAHGEACARYRRRPIAPSAGIGGILHEIGWLPEVPARTCTHVLIDGLAFKCLEVFAVYSTTYTHRDESLQLDMNTAPAQLHVALRGLDTEGTEVLAIPGPETESHGLGLLRGYPQLVLTLAGPPGMQRTMRIRHAIPTAGSYHLLLQDLSPTGRVTEVKSRLRSNTVPRTTTTTTEDGFDEPKIPLVNSDYIVSWVTLPSATTISSSADGSQVADNINYTATPPSSTVSSSDFSLAARDFQWPQHPTPALTAPTSLAMFASQSPPQVCTSSSKRQSNNDVLEVASSTKRQRSSVGQDTVQSKPGKISDAIDLGCNNPENAVSSNESNSDDDDLPTACEPSFPCPFSLRHPQGRRCNHKKMKSARSVEKHLFLHHRRPPFCPICRTTFDSYAARDGHIIIRTCERTESLSSIEGLTETQTRDLSLCLDSGKSVTEQYRAMWDIVHPGVECPVELKEVESRES